MTRNFIDGCVVTILFTTIITAIASMTTMTNLNELKTLTESQEKVISQQSKLLKKIDWKGYEEFKKKETIKQVLMEITSDGIAY